ncbi:lamin tail domain-containing protein [Candidatus Woesearchaeota archaeon]|nr:lamin tail domain-containing protein [Candidatus Woesearchaeota archaeon]
MKYTLILFLLAIQAQAMVISDIMYDPEESESTGEYITIYNNDTTTQDIGEWWITTERSQKDAIIPKNTLLNPGQHYTIGDPNTTAELNEQITLNNDNSGVQLVFNNTIIDAVGWGNPSKEFFKGTPAQDAEEGASLTRIGYSENNAEDFTTSKTKNTNRIKIEITIEKQATMTDDETKPGNQIKPRAGQTRTIEVFTDAPAVFQNKTYLPNKGVAKIPLEYHMKPGNYTILTSKELNFEYLPLKSFIILDKELKIKTSPGSSAQGTLRIKNNGNTQLEITMTHTFTEIQLTLQNTTLQPAEEKNMIITAKIPQNIKPTTYEGTISLN